MHPFTKLLTAAILILALLSAGCTDTDSSSANSPTAVATTTQAATAEPTPVATESHWYDDRPYYNPTVIKADENLFGIEIEGIKYQENTIGYTMYDENKNLIFKQSVYTSFDPYDDLQSDQARALEAQYGEAELVVMEQADTDGDGALDRVAVRYVGSKGVAEFIMPYGKPTSKSVTGVLSEMIVAKL